MYPGCRGNSWRVWGVEVTAGVSGCGVNSWRGWGVELTAGVSGVSS